MSILREISEARIEFYEKRGHFPSRLIASPDTLDQIKAALYPDSTFDHTKVPLVSYDLMTIQIDANNHGWELT